MVKQTGRNTNRTDTTIVTTVTLNSSTATTLSVAKSDRTYWKLQNLDNVKTIIKWQAASIDNDKEGDIVVGKFAWWQLDEVSMRTQEISAILESGSGDVIITED